MKKLYPFLCLFLLLMACQSGNLPGSKAQQTAIKQVAEEKLGTDVKYKANSEKTFVLCSSDQAISGDRSRNDLKFLVYDLANSKVALELNVGAGTVKWYSANEVEVYRTPGVMAEGQTRDDYTTIYNVVTGTATKKSDL